MKHLIFALITLSSLPSAAFATEFVSTPVKSQRLACSPQVDARNNETHIALGNLDYRPNLKIADIKRIECEKVEFAGRIYFALKYESLSVLGNTPRRLSIYELVSYRAATRSLVTMRSYEIGDDRLLDDAPPTDLLRDAKITWGKSKRDNQVMVKLDYLEEKQNVTVYMRQNEKADWFVDEGL